MEPIDKAIADLRATGLSGTAIAEQVGICKSSVYQVLQKEDVKALVEKEYNEFLQCLPDARRNIQNLITTYDSIKDEKDKHRAWCSSMEILRSSGILAGPMAQITINNIQINNNQLLSPVVANILDIIDADIVEQID